MENENSVWLQVLLYATQCSIVWKGKSVDRACSQWPFFSSYDQTEKRKLHLTCFCVCFQMRHRNYWRSSQTGSLSRCQISTTTCLTFSTMRAACTLLCRLVLAAQEVRKLMCTLQIQHSSYVHKFIKVFLWNMHAQVFLCKRNRKKKPRDTHYAWEGIKSQQVISCWRAHNRYPLWTELCSRIILEYMQRWG